MYKRISFSIVLFSLLSSFSPTHVHAQASSWFGVRAGVNLASETFTTLPDNASTGIKTGVIGGATFEHWFGDMLAINASLLFDQKGVHEEYSPAASNRVDTFTHPNTIYSGNDDYALSYLEIPILLKWAIGDGDIRPFLEAGPSIGLLLSASETPSGSVAPVTDLKSFLQSTDVSVDIGAGIVDQLYRGPMLFFDAGYAVGLTKIYKTVPVRYAADNHLFLQPIDPSSSKSGDIRITVGVMWKL